MPLPYLIEAEAPAATPASGAPHKFGYAVLRTVAGDPVWQVWKGPESDPDNLVFEIDLTGRLRRGSFFEAHPAASEAAMLLLDAQVGDYAIRSDNDTTYILTGSDPTDIADWTVLFEPPTSFSPWLAELLL